MQRKPVRDKYLEFGLASWSGKPTRFHEFHRHNEIELLFVEQGRLEYIFGRGRVVLAAGNFAVFWGAMPHQLIDMQRGSQTHWLTVPLAWFLQWQMPAPLLRSLLSGKVFVETAAHDTDLALFNQWHDDLKSRDAERQKLVVLEAEARLRRLALRHRGSGVRASTAGGAQAAAMGRVERMACFIAQHYTRDLRVAEIAAAAGLNADYAITLFRKTCGMSLVDYITQHRVTHAQRLLATSDLKVLDIAFASGFGSASRFYAVFEQLCGVSPKVYRATMTAG
jgi:AraC family transcriptional regulator, melibiose operon regulatory protein